MRTSLAVIVIVFATIAYMQEQRIEKLESDSHLLYAVTWDVASLRARIEKIEDKLGIIRDE
ncbi:MAG: hypothetical protein ABI162_08710 [Luteolibacter sp.]